MAVDLLLTLPTTVLNHKAVFICTCETKARIVRQSEGGSIYLQLKSIVAFYLLKK